MQEEQKQEQVKHKKWYKKWWGILIILVFLPFVTIWYIWKKTNWNKSVKIILTILIILFVAIVSSNSNNKTIKQTQKEEPASNTEQTRQTKESFFSDITIKDVNISNNEILILGSTDLPDSSSLIVDFDVWGRSGSDLYIGVSEKTIVSNGEFKITLIIPQREEFEKGPYEISVLFTPRGQSSKIIKLVGKDGENLTGELVDESGTFKTMKLIEKKDLQLSITPLSYIFQQPSKFLNGSAEHTLAEYVLAWRDKNWGKMSNFAQKTWVSNETDSEELLETWYDFKNLKGFEITNVEKVSETTIDITFTVQYEATTNQISKKKIIARVIKEIAPYKPSEQGEWGVNPTSAIREENIKL